MPRTAALRHIHQYTKTYPNIRREEPIWKCALPGCSHFIPYNTTVVGRMSLCPECMNKFPMEEDNLWEDTPRCQDCRSGLKEPAPGAMDEIMKAIENDEIRAKIAIQKDKPKTEVTDDEIEWYKTLHK